jgi:hypothetical protein
MRRKKSKNKDGKVQAFRLFKIKASNTGAFGDNPEDRRSACRTTSTPQ